MSLKQITDVSFNDDTKEGISLVDFYADWCGPCRVLEPMLDELSRYEDVKGKVKFFRLDVDKNPETAKKYDIMSLPSVMIFKDGLEVRKFVGTVGAGAYLNVLKEILKQNA